jgi:uncharacterized protein YkwD
MEEPGALLTVLEGETTARARVGVYGQWLQVRDAASRVGYVAAWYVEEAQTAAPATASSPVVQPPPAPAFVVPSPQSLIDAINAERVKRNVHVLKPHPILMSNAQRHADDMAANGLIDHLSADGSRPFQRHLAAGYPLAGDLSLGGFASENIVAFPNMTVQQAIESWFGDDPHTNTMVSDKYFECGAGIAVSGETVYYCFDVARPSTTTAKPAPVVVAPPAGKFLVYVPKTLAGGLRIRKTGNSSGGLVRVADPGEWLAVDEGTAKAKAKIGQQDQWIKIKDQKGNTGYVAAWLVSATP